MARIFLTKTRSRNCLETVAFTQIIQVILASHLPLYIFHRLYTLREGKTYFGDTIYVKFFPTTILTSPVLFDSIAPFNSKSLIFLELILR